MRGIFSALAYPFGYFATQGATSSQLYACTMEAIRFLSAIDLEVRAICLMELLLFVNCMMLEYDSHTKNYSIVVNRLIVMAHIILLLQRIMSKSLLMKCRTVV